MNTFFSLYFDTPLVINDAIIIVPANTTKIFGILVDRGLSSHKRIVYQISKYNSMRQLEAIGLDNSILSTSD